MTEEEFLRWESPVALLKCLTNTMSNRKYRLFLCGWYRRSWDRLTPESRKAVELAERFADGEISRVRLMWAIKKSLRSPGPTIRLGCRANDAIDWAIQDAIEIGYECALFQTVAIRCLAGNPFRPQFVDRAVLTSNVRSLSQATYTHQRFENLPILADALEDAGCDNADILGHLRSGGDHVRGCWAVDLILGKE
jgi:hypothetical protein